METIENHLAKLWGDLMFYRENTFFPPHSYSSLEGKARLPASSHQAGTPGFLTLSSSVSGHPAVGRPGCPAGSGLLAGPGEADLALPSWLAWLPESPQRCGCGHRGLWGGPYMEPGECRLWQVAWKKMAVF